MNTKVTKENIEEPSSETDPEKAENEEYRNYKEEPGDDDGENRHPEKRASVTLTGLFITKAMIGSGLLNVPFIFKTLGIFFGLFASIFFNFVSVLSCYFLLRCKDITQRYSYSIYSKLTMGLLGTITCKIAIVIRSFSLCCVLLKICGKILRTLLLIFFSEYSNKFFLNGEFLAVVLALIIIELFPVEEVIADLDKQLAAGAIDEHEASQMKSLTEARYEFTDDHRVLEMAKVPDGVSEEEIKKAIEAGQIKDYKDGYFSRGEKEWKAIGGKYYYDTQEQREVFGEALSSWDELVFDEDGLLNYGSGFVKLKKI